MSVPFNEMRRRLGLDQPHEAVGTPERRGFLKLVGASIALAGIEGCTRMPASNIVPYINQPELTPGIPRYYATSMVLDGYATGLLVESHEGRPTKIEGNPDHPASLGAAGVFEQASVLQLYDPHRARQVRRAEARASWDGLAAALAPEALRARLGSGGAGLFLLLEPTSSPLEGELLDRLRERYPSVGVHFYAPLTPAPDALIPQYDLRVADVVVAIESNFLAEGPFHLRYAHDFAARRRPDDADGGMSRCYAIESAVTPTGTAADHRFAVRPAEMVAILEHLFDAVSGRTDGAPVSGPAQKWLAAVARDLRAHAARSLVIAGPYLPRRAQVLALQINDALGNVGHTVWFTPSPLIGAGDARQSLALLVDALHAGQVDTLVCAGGNPAYATAGRLGLDSLIRRVRQSVYLGLYEDETARACQWTIPAAHYLESWGDARAYDGTLSVVQPLIRPIAGGRTTTELLSLLLGAPGTSSYDLLRQSWQRRGVAGAGFEEGWRTALRRGFVDGSAFPRAASVPAFTPDLTAAESSPTIDVSFRPHSRVRDGAFANNGWLQELPEPVTSLTWGNAAHLSPATARHLGVANGDAIDVEVSSRRIRIPALVVPGHADDAITVHFGYGRDGAEAVARSVGVDVYPLWPGDTFSISGGRISRAPGAARMDLAITQPHHELETSNPARVMSVADLLHRQPPGGGQALTLYQPPTDLPERQAQHQWAMTIDLDACIGCGACMVACQAENNVPVVGRDSVARGRQMHWLRIDWYATGCAVDPPAIAQPMLCQQCEKAPCEYVCPVEATVHSRDGLNEMIYNRCVGTRFCSNNCPYKVRRFNWFDYNAGLSDTERLVKNPDVTVRERGVMEKCTFCVQRIREAEIASRVNARPLKGSDIRTACQQACPTHAIAFGSLDEQDSPMVVGRNSRRAYAVLDEYGTEPRVRYLARVRNTNPELATT